MWNLEQILFCNPGQSWGRKRPRRSRRQKRHRVRSFAHRGSIRARPRLPRDCKRPGCRESEEESNLGCTAQFRCSVGVVERYVGIDLVNHPKWLIDEVFDDFSKFWRKWKPEFATFLHFLEITLCSKIQLVFIFLMRGLLRNSGGHR